MAIPPRPVIATLAYTSDSSAGRKEQRHDPSDIGFEIGRHHTYDRAVDCECRKSILALAPEIAVSRWFNTGTPLTLSGLRGRPVLLHAFQMLCPGCVSHGTPQTQRAFDLSIGPAGHRAAHGVRTSRGHDPGVTGSFHSRVPIDLSHRS